MVALRALRLAPRQPERRPQLRRPCDTSDPDLDGSADNTVTLTILRLLGAPATEGGDPVALTDWQNPCAAPHNASGCQLTVPCRENADSRVTFDLTILRDARQGFFDVAVSFADLFCSAKVDCADEDGPLLLVHGPGGERVPSVVLGLTCTDGDAATGVSDTTHLYLDPVAIRCGAPQWEIAPWLGPGNLYPAAGALPPPIVQAMVFRGVQALGPDNDECLGSPCGANATCSNNPGAYTCACLPGYSGDPYGTGCTLITYDLVGAGTNASPRTWSNGTLATSCEAYRRPSSPFSYPGQTGSGVYRIDLGSGPFNVYCDMVNDGGGWTLVVNISSTTNQHGTTTGAHGDITSPISGAARLSDAVINQLSTIGYWRYRCATRNAYVRNTANTWACQRSNPYNRSLDRDRDGTFEYAANRDGYVLSDYIPAAPAGHTNYAASVNGEGHGRYLAPSWNQNGNLWAR